MSLTTRTSAFGFTNNTTSQTKTATLYDMKELENYSLVEDEAGLTRFNNLTTPVNHGEILEYRSKRVDTVKTRLEFPKDTTIINKGVMYAVQIEDDLVTVSDSEDSNFRQDDPIIAYLTIIHPVSGFVTEGKVGEVVDRLISACKKEDGSWRFNELMRKSTKPTRD